MATTPNYGWVMPDPTDFVTNLPADFEVFGDAVDADLAGLLGGTTGQVLVKSSATDHDFAWATSPGISSTIFDAKGDLLSATANDTPARLAVGTNGQVLTADSAESTGLKWATPTSEGLVLLSTTTLTGASVTVSSISSIYKNLHIVFRDVYPSTNGSRLRFRFNGSTSTSDYNFQPSGDNFFNFPVVSPSSGSNGQNGAAYLIIRDYKNTVTWKTHTMMQSTTQSTNDNNWVGAEIPIESWTNINAINSITILASSGNINGTMLIYGEN